MVQALRKREIDFMKVPFDEIIDVIQNTYNHMMGKGEEFVLLYGNQISRALEIGDYEALADILQIVSEHLLIIENFKNTYMLNKQLEKNWFQEKCQKAYLNNLRKIEKREQVYGKKNYIPFQGKGVVYSAITGDYDSVKEPKYMNSNLDYILFTNNPNLHSDVWQIRFVDNLEQLDNIRLARRIKVLGHEYLTEYDFSIWVDGKLEIIGDFVKYIERYKRNEPMLNFNHYINESIYDEITLCKKLGKGNGKIMDKQISRYRKEGFPEHYGLTDTGIIVRDIHNKNVKTVMESWWKEIKNGSYRDQLSFCYACWKNDFLYDTCDLYIYGNEYVKLYAHSK